MRTVRGGGEEERRRGGEEERKRGGEEETKRGGEEERKKGGEEECGSSSAEAGPFRIGEAYRMLVHLWGLWVIWGSGVRASLTLVTLV